LWLWMSWMVSLARAGFLPVEETIARDGSAVVIATGLRVHTGPRAESPVAYTLRIGYPVELVGAADGWGQLDTGFWVDLRFVARLDGTMKDALQEARLAALGTPREEVWRERIAAWEARPAFAPGAELDDAIRLAAPQQPGVVHMALEPGEPVPAEVWVLPRRGWVRRGVSAGLMVPPGGCRESGRRDVRIEVDLAGESAIAFSIAREPPASWRIEAPAQEHTTSAPAEMQAWLSALSGGRPVTVHTSAVGRDLWVRMGFRSVFQDPAHAVYILGDVFVRDGQRTVPPFRVETFLHSEAFTGSPGWYRDLDGDGTLEALIFSECNTEAFDASGNRLEIAYGDCCGC
jgi:hypothetical protein